MAKHKSDKLGEYTFSKVTYRPFTSGIVFYWSSPELGFGEINIYHEKDGSLTVDSEAMSKEFVVNVFKELIDGATKFS